MSLKTYHIAPAEGDKPENIVLFLHGLGDSGSGGLLEIGRIWQRVLPKTEFLCPDAPFAFDMAPPDFEDPRAVAGTAERAAKMRQWFSLKEFSRESVRAGVSTAAPILNNYIDGILKERNLPASKLALVGFSQGTMMSLYVGLRRADPVACILGYSGILVDPENLGTEKKSSPPVMLVHGTMDEVVPFMAMADAERGLKSAGIAVDTLNCPGLGHSIDDAGLMAGMAFLQKHLK